MTKNTITATSAGLSESIKRIASGWGVALIAALPVSSLMAVEPMETEFWMDDTFDLPGAVNLLSEGKVRYGNSNSPGIDEVFATQGLLGGQFFTGESQNINTSINSGINTGFYKGQPIGFSMIYNRNGKLTLAVGSSTMAENTVDYNAVPDFPNNPNYVDTVLIRVRGFNGNTAQLRNIQIRDKNGNLFPEANPALVMASAKVGYFPTANQSAQNATLTSSDSPSGSMVMSMTSSSFGDGFSISGEMIFDWPEGQQTPDYNNDKLQCNVKFGSSKVAQAKILCPDPYGFNCGVTSKPDASVYQSSVAKVSTHNAAIDPPAVDLASPAFTGFLWQREFANKDQYLASGSSKVGNNWALSSIPMLNRRTGKIVLASRGLNAISAFKYNIAMDSYTPVNPHYDTLEHDALNREIIWKTHDGYKFVFFDFTNPSNDQVLAFAPELRGTFKRMIDPAGNVTSVTSWIDHIPVSATVSQFGTTITGSGFSPSMVGKQFRVNAGQKYTITAATNNQLTLSSKYFGSSASAVEGYVLPSAAYRISEMTRSGQAANGSIITESWKIDWLGTDVTAVNVASGSPIVTGTGFSSSWIGGTFQVGTGSVYTIADATSTALTLSTNYAAVSASSTDATIVPKGASLLGRVTLRRKTDAGTWENIRSVEYTYYGSGMLGGNSNDLRLATIKEASGGVISRNYYRYSPVVNGFGGIKYVFYDNALNRAMASLGGLTGVLAAPDGSVAGFADSEFTFDSLKRTVASAKIQDAGCGCPGTGVGVFSSSLIHNPNPAFSPSRRDHWSSRFIETRPDGNQTTTYSNSYNQRLLQVYVEVATGKTWRSFWQYDSSGNVILSADTVAITGHDESFNDLLNYSGGNWQYISDSTGFVENKVWATTTTATETVAGDVKGRLISTTIRKGELGAAVPQSQTKYFLRIGGDGTVIYPVASETIYRDDAGLNPQTTNYSYTWRGTTTIPLSRSVVLPVVSTAQNGSGVATGRTDVYDAWSRPVWSRNEDGFISYVSYDQYSGGIVTSISDVNTTKISDFTDLPPGWVTPNSGGLHLKTQCLNDILGRCVRYVDPKGVMTWTVYKDTEREVRVYPGWTGSQTTGPIRVSRYDRGQSFRENFVTSVAPAVSGDVPTGGENLSVLTSSQIAQLSRTLLDAGDRPIETRTYINLPVGGYTKSLSLGVVDTDYYRTQIAYDVRGRPSRVVSADGTIMRSVYDARDRLVSRWKGTNDTPAVGDWSPSNNDGSSNMVQITSAIYDNGNAGPDLLTQQIVHADAGVTYSTNMTYDYRYRPIVVRGADKVAITTIYDNLGRAIISQTFADANENFVVESTELRSKSESFYDERGQMWKSVIHEVSPTNGAIGDRLETTYWYNARGMQVKSRSPSKLFAKTQFDGVGRPVASYSSYQDSETSYADALTTTGDIVITQSKTIYDAVGNIVSSTNYQRNDNLATSVTGDLAASSTNAFIQTSVHWYDGAHRPTGVATVGRDNGATKYVWNAGALIDANANGIPDLAEGAALNPNASNDYIVSRSEYDAFGRTYRSRDNLNRITELQFDLAGQVVKSIRNYTDGALTETETATDQIGENQYLPGGRISKRIAYNPKGTGKGVESQVTTYLYNSTVDKSWNTETIYPDSSDTTNSGSDQVKRSYDRLGRLTQTTDQRGVVHTLIYDAAGRMSSDQASTIPTLAAPYTIDTATRRLDYAYDDLSRLKTVSSYDSLIGGNILNQVEHTFDAWANTIKTAQSHSGAVNVSTPSVQTAFTDGASGGIAKYVRPTSVTYPNGRQEHILYPSDSTIGGHLIRADAQAEDSAGTIKHAQYTYFGSGSILAETRPEVTNGTNVGLRLDLGVSGSYSGMDRFGRVTNQRWKTTSGTAREWDRFAYTYDRASRRLTRDLTWTGAPTIQDEVYTYDTLDRLATFKKGTLASGTISDASSKYTQKWTNDLLGNWRTFQLDADGGAAGANLTQTRSHNAVNEIETDNDDQNAPGASLTGTGMGWIAPRYDKSGNLISGPKPGAETTRQHYVYDAWNRLTAVKQDDGLGNPGSVIAAYKYDASNRRIQKQVWNGASYDLYDIYYNNGWQQLEVRKNNVVSEQTVWSFRYIDAPVLRLRDTNGDGTLDEKIYFTNDAAMHVTAAISTAGVVLERYSYDPYGKRSVWNAAMSATLATSAYDVRDGFTGRLLDVESGLWYFRNRYFDSSLGRFTQRDSMGYIDGYSLYRAYFVINGLDPSGNECLLSWWECALSWALPGIEVAAETTAAVSNTANVLTMGATQGVVDLGTSLVAGKETADQIAKARDTGIGGKIGAATGEVLSYVNPANAGKNLLVKMGKMGLSALKEYGMNELQNVVVEELEAALNEALADLLEKQKALDICPNAMVGGPGAAGSGAVAGAVGTSADAVKAAIELCKTLNDAIKKKKGSNALTEADKKIAEAEKSEGSLVRFGKGPESAEQLAEQAAKAEQAGFPHGVSTRLKDKVSGSDKAHRSAPMSAVEEQFEVIQTGKDPRHHTVVLPKPVTPEVADQFNSVFNPK